MAIPSPCSGDWIERAGNQSPMGLALSLQALRGGVPLTSTAEDWPALRTALLEVTPPYPRLASEIARLDTLFGVAP